MHKHPSNPPVIGVSLVDTLNPVSRLSFVIIIHIVERHQVQIVAVELIARLLDIHNLAV